MKRKFLIILSVILTTVGFTSKADSLTTNNSIAKGGYNFWFYNPDDVEQDEPKPVVVFLHGASLCGNNLQKVTRYGTISAIQKGRDIDAFVIAPQNPGGSWNPKKIMDIIDWAGDNYNIDYDRVYVLGMSLGGYGTIDLAATYPDRIAAAIAMCGGASVRDLSGLKDVPLWVIHGTADNAVSVSQSDKVVNTLNGYFDGNSPRLIYNRVPGMNHSQPARMFYLTQSYDWLFKHTLKDRERKIHPVFAINDAMKTAYSDLRGKSRSKKSNTTTAKVRSSKPKTQAKAKSKKTNRRRS